MLRSIYMKKWFTNFMMGRYGSDNFGRFLCILSCILLVVSIIVGGASTAGMIIWGIALAMLIYAYFRMFSRKVNKRFAENYKYLNIKNKFTGFFKKRIDRIKQSKTHKFFKCPGCKAVVRVPKGKGKIKITCPKCGVQFVKKT